MRNEKKIEIKLKSIVFTPNIQPNQQELERSEEESKKNQKEMLKGILLLVSC